MVRWTMAMLRTSHLVSFLRRRQSDLGHCEPAAAASTAGPHRTAAASSASPPYSLPGRPRQGSQDLDHRSGGESRVGTPWIPQQSAGWPAHGRCRKPPCCVGPLGAFLRPRAQRTWRAHLLARRLRLRMFVQTRTDMLSLETLDGSSMSSDQVSNENGVHLPAASSIYPLPAASSIYPPTKPLSARDATSQFLVS